MRRLLVHLACAVPLALALWAAAMGGLSANPIEDITHRAGAATLTLLLVTLAFRPVEIVTGRRGHMRYRRAVGMWSFAYATIHLLIFVGLDYGFDPTFLKEGVAKKPYAWLGFTGWLLMAPRAATSMGPWKRWYGRYQQAFDYSVYACAVVGVAHFWWLVKTDHTKPAVYGAILLLLLAMRTPPVTGWFTTNRPARS
ncbi:MAG: sulfoxide reductase heme-binding subunit YedZ [Nitrospinae bacterium]|nr:sulfoxide reductase heme-binding subunit YedZ [Nitrospinota bacterium]